jgi:hypothetical protein
MFERLKKIEKGIAKGAGIASKEIGEYRKGREKKKAVKEKEEIQKLQREVGIAELQEKKEELKHQISTIHPSKKRKLAHFLMKFGEAEYKIGKAFAEAERKKHGED